MRLGRTEVEVDRSHLKRVRTGRKVRTTCVSPSHSQTVTCENSVFVDKAFENKIRAQLAGSKFSSNEYIDEMMSVFESKAVRMKSPQCFIF